MISLLPRRDAPSAGRCARRPTPPDGTPAPRTLAAAIAAGPLARRISRLAPIAHGALRATRRPLSRAFDALPAWSDERVRPLRVAPPLAAARSLLDAKPFPLLPTYPRRKRPLCVLSVPGIDRLASQTRHHQSSDPRAHRSARLPRSLRLHRRVRHAPLPSLRLRRQRQQPLPADRLPPASLPPVASGPRSRSTRYPPCPSPSLSAMPPAPGVRPHTAK